MTTVELSNRIALNSAAAATLNAAARFWFVVAVAGQWMFACYIALVYGGAVVQGNLQAATSRLAHGYEAGNPVGNTVLFTHLLFAAAISFMGALQLIPKIRARFPLFHRWNGRIYIVVAFSASLHCRQRAFARREDFVETVGRAVDALQGWDAQAAVIRD